MTKDIGASLPGMEGGGFYNRNSALQDAAIQKVLPLWENMIAQTTFHDRSLTIVDYGSSEGKNSLAPISLAIERYRKDNKSDQPINVIHTDLPGNDFSALFRTIMGHENSYLRFGQNIYPSAVGRSYFEQILPAGSVDLAWNSWTLQWLSRNPVEDPDFLYGAYSKKDWVREAVDKQLSEDWRKFLQVRSIELKPGGRMLCLFGSKGENMFGWEWAVNAFWQVITDMHQEGLLSEEDKTRVNLPLGPRGIIAIQEPFDQNNEYSGLALEYAEVFQSPDPYWPEYQRTKDRKQFGENWKNFMKAVFAPVIRSQIDPKKDTSALVEDMFDRFAATIAANPRETEHFVGIAIVKKIS